MSSRSLDSALATALSDDVVRPAIFFTGAFKSDSIHLWTGIGDIVVFGETYTGIGSIMAIDPIEETADIQAQGWKLTLNGLDQSVTALALSSDEVAQDLLGTISLALLDSNGAIIGAPAVLSQGRLDFTQIVEQAGENTATVVLSYESRLVDLERPRIWRWTDQDQKTTVPWDRGFEFVGRLADLDITWGSSG